MRVQLGGTRAPPWLQQRAGISSISSPWEGGWIPSGLAGLCWLGLWSGWRRGELLLRDKGQS